MSHCWSACVFFILGTGFHYVALAGLEHVDQAGSCLQSLGRRVCSTQPACSTCLWLAPLYCLCSVVSQLTPCGLPLCPLFSAVLHCAEHHRSTGSSVLSLSLRMNISIRLLIPTTESAGILRLPDSRSWKERTYGQYWVYLYTRNLAAFVSFLSDFFPQLLCKYLIWGITLCKWRCFKFRILLVLAM